MEILEVDGCAEFAVHESLQVKASERVLRIATDQRSESSYGTRIAGLQLFEGSHVRLRCAAGIDFGLKRLESADRLHPASEQEVANRATAEPLNVRCEAATHAITCAKRLVGRFQARGNVDGVSP